MTKEETLEYIQEDNNIEEKPLYLAKLELMEQESRNIPFSKKEVESLPKGFTETSKFLTKSQLNKIK